MYNIEWLISIVFSTTRPDRRTLRNTKRKSNRKLPLPCTSLLNKRHAHFIDIHSMCLSCAHQMLCALFFWCGRGAQQTGDKSSFILFGRRRLAFVPQIQRIDLFISESPSIHCCRFLFFVHLVSPLNGSCTDLSQMQTRNATQCELWMARVHRRQLIYTNLHCFWCFFFSTLSQIVFGRSWKWVQQKPFVSVCE